MPVTAQHGTRSRYTSGCRCDECRTANRVYGRASYRTTTRGQTNPLVPAAPVVEHLRALSAQGIGRRTVAEACDVSENTLARICREPHTRIRRNLAEAVLEVDEGAATEGCRVSAARTVSAIRLLMAYGLRETEIHERIRKHVKSPRVPLDPTARVWARTEMRVLRLLRLVEATEAERERLTGWCGACQETHSQERRLALLEKLGGATLAQVHAQAEHWWPDSDAGRLLLQRDRRLLRVRRTAP